MDERRAAEAKRLADEYMAGMKKKLGEGPSVGPRSGTSDSRAQSMKDDADQQMFGMRRSLDRGSALKEVYPEAHAQGLQYGDAAADRLKGEANQHIMGMQRSLDEGPSVGTRRMSDRDAERMSAQADEMTGGLRQNLAEGPAARRLSGGTPETGYETELTRGAEKAFRGKFGRGEGEDYDLRGAFAGGATEGQRFDRRDDGVEFPDHLPDTYKKPSHETFSDESQYARDEPNLAGSWKGDQYQDNPKGPPRWLKDYMDRPPPAADSIGSDYQDDESPLVRTMNRRGAQHG